MVFGRLRLAAVSLVTLLGLILSLAPNAQAQGGTLRGPTAATLDTTLPQPLETSFRLDEQLAASSGRVSVVVRLTERPMLDLGLGQRQLVERQQDALIAVAKALDPSAIVTGRTRNVLNAVMLDLDASVLTTLAADSRVQKIERIVNFEQDLTDTVPYIGATSAVQALGSQGENVRVAVLDSGIDYTHAKLGGVGTLDAYTAAYGTGPEDPRNTTNDDLFPTARVVAGFDFVGEVWPNGPNGFADADLRPDPDPIDFEGHGTHVADIIGGNPVPDPERARVRAVHASPDAPNVDILINDAPAFTDVPFTAISPYALLPAGTYNVKVVPTGTTSPVVIDADVTVEAGKDYTVAATGLLADIAPLVLVDTNTAPATGKASVRFVHLSPNAPAVDVAVTGGPVLFPNVSFQGVGPYTSVPAGTYDLEVRLAGKSTVVLALPDVRLVAGKVYTAYALGLVGGTGAQALSAAFSEDNVTAGGGVAPKVDLIGVKVCSAVSSSCSSTAILQGIDFSVDPNGDGDVSDRAHIINMSLGASYGLNYSDSLSSAVDNATSLGTLTVASAGNSADKPYVVGTPSAARTALSVAQTTVPSDKVFPISAGGVTVFGIAQPWAPEPTTAIASPLAYGGAYASPPPAGRPPTNTLGCDAYPAGSLTGRILLVDRGVCAASIKGSNGAAAGAVAVLIANNAAGSVPPSFGFGGGEPTVPTLSITQGAGLSLRPLSDITATIDGAAPQSALGSLVGTSSRGPAIGQMFYGNRLQFGQIIKPEIGAPGGSISAVAGSGGGVEAFGGTSGAAPMVSGAAALLYNATSGELSPLELKARLMNTGETNILNGPAAFNVGLAPITRIGGGEVRINRAVEAEVSAWESTSGGGALSFGFVDARRPQIELTRNVVVRNYSNRPITFNISNSFRFADDEANGAVRLELPNLVTVTARSKRTIDVRLIIDSAKVRLWQMNAGSGGANPGPLTTMEYDGYLRFYDTSGNTANMMTMPWHVLPRLSGNVLGPSRVRVDKPATYVNNGVGPAFVTTYSLLGTSRLQNLPDPGTEVNLVDLRAVGYATFNATGICPVPEGGVPNYGLEFAINNYYRQTHGFTPGQIWVILDTDRDGTNDFAVINRDVSFNNITDGRTLSWVLNLRTGDATALFFAEHQFESENWVLRACASQFQDDTRPGSPLPAPALGQPVDATIEAYDFYGVGGLQDTITGITFAPGGERYRATIADTITSRGGTAQLIVTDTGSRTNSTETGVMLYLTSINGNVSSGAREGRETLLVTVR